MADDDQDDIVMADEDPDDSMSDHDHDHDHDLPNPIIAAMEEDNDVQAEVIEAILQEHPEAVRQHDGEGYLPIHYAIKHVLPPQVVRLLLRAWPESVFEVTYDDETLLPAHLVCMRAGVLADREEDAVVLDTVRAVVEAFPRALRVRDMEGRLPLHIAFRYWPPPLVVTRYLVERDPESLRIRDGDGYVPFHHAVWCHGPRLSDVQYLAAHFPGCVRVRAYDGQTPFFLAVRCDWTPDDVVRFLLEQWSGSIQSKDTKGRTPLHAAAGSKNRTSVELLLKLWTESAQQKSNDGRLALHEAAGVGCMDATRLLVEHRPEAVRETCKRGRLAVHEAAIMARNVLVRYLVAQWPESVRETTISGWLPIHLALQYRPWNLRGQQDGMGVTRFLVGQSPESLWSATKEGYLPLHVAAGKGIFELPEFEWGDLNHDGEDLDEYVQDRLLTAPEYELHLVQFLARRAPTSLRVMSKEGMLPEHYAIASGFSLPAVRYLLEEWPEDEEHPESLQYRTGTGVPALILALDRKTQSLEFAELLVQCRPRMLEDADDRGFTPLHYAVKHCTSLKTWNFLVEQRPKSLGQGDEHGSLPLHVYLKRLEPAPSLEQVQYLVEQRPAALQVADKSGSLPLHVAVSQRNVERPIVQFLVEQRPQSLRQKNGAGLLPLHVAAVNDAPLDILYYLASKKPESIYENHPRSEPPRPHKRPKVE